MTEPLAESLGATAEDWFQFDFELGLGKHLLPCVPASPNVKVLPGSALEGKVGKIPSMFNHEGLAHGMPAWQKREILGNEIQAWSNDRRLNLCVRTGLISGVYAIDVDVEDRVTAEAIGLLIWAALGRGDPITTRVRANSGKFLFPFRMEEPCKKRKIKLDNNPKGPAIELLADGQQFVAAGLHSSGVRYQWLPGLPTALPRLTLEQVNRLWQQLTSAYAMAPSPGIETTSKSISTPSLTPNSMSSRSGTETGSTESQSSSQSVLTEISESDWSTLLAALRFMLDKVPGNDEWSEVGYALLSLQKTRSIERLWLDFSYQAAGYEAGAPEQWWQTHKNQTPRSDYRHIFNLAREKGWRRVADPSLFPPVRQSQNVQGSEVRTSENETNGSDTNAGRSGGSDGSDLANSGAGEDSLFAPLPERPIVQLVDANFSEIIDQLENVLVPYVYVQGPNLVRRTEAHTDKRIQRKTDALMLIQVTKEWLVKRLGELCQFQKWSQKKADWVNTEPSMKYSNNLFGQGGWTRLLPLDAIARAPFIRQDGSICDVAGYDSRTRVLYVPSTEYPSIPTVPDQDCARAALGRIRGVFDQFPWKESASESAFLSHILTETARLAIDRSPMFFYDAPVAGTGKGLLQEMAARIVHGSEPALRAWVGDGDEIRKSLYASLLAGDRSLWFDNVPTGHKVRSPELCAFITSAEWKDRKLGESETLGVPNKMVLVASGNNITPVSDLARRSLVIRMDANTERLKDRVFKIPEGQLRPYVMEHRPQMLVDALTVIKAFHALKDVPTMPVPLPGFGQWSHFCRDPLIWLGLSDPVITQNETDDETAGVGTIFEKLYAQFGDREFTGLDIARLVNGIADSAGELANEMQQSGLAEPNNPTKIGYWLRGCRDKISSGLKLVHARDTKKCVKWKFIRTHEELTVAMSRNPTDGA